MTLDKVLQYAGIVVALSSAVTIKVSMLLTFLLFFVGLVMVKFGTCIKIHRDHEIFQHGEKNG